MGKVTVENLLTMTVPYKYQTEPYEEFFLSANWVKTAMDFVGGGGNIGDFQYFPIIETHILSGILVRAAGRPALDFAAEHLFSPLGIPEVHNVVLRDKEKHMAWSMKEKHDRSWVVDPQGINTSSWGLALTPVDLAKIGRLYLNNSRWDNRQIIPSRWAAESTRERSRWDRLSYGYLWWIIDEREHSYAAIGDGGNEIYINSKKQLVIVITSLMVPDVKDRIELIKERIEPIFED